MKAWGAWEYAETTRNEHKFTHAKYNKIRKKNNLFRDQIIFSKIIKILFGVLGVESPHGGAIMQPRIVGTWI